MFTEFSKTLRIALPLIISNVSQMALGLIDSAMIGPIDYRQLAASSLVINVLAIPTVLGAGMNLAISPLVAMAHGQQNIAKASGVLYNGFLLSTCTALIIAAAIVTTSGLLYHLGQEDVVAEFAIPYYKVMAWSMIPMLMFNAVKQFSDGLELTKTAMVLSLASLPLNAVLNYIFIYGKLGFPRLELLGAGYATLIVRILLALIMILLVLTHRLYRPYIAIYKTAWKVRTHTWKELLHIGIPSSMQYGMESAAFSVSGIMIGWLGAMAQAAHQIALNIASLTFMASLGLSLAGSIRVANAFGRNDKTHLRRIGTSTIWGGLAYGCICALLFIVFKNQLPLLFTTNSGVALLASSLLVFGAFFQISDATQAIGVGLLRGTRDVRMPTIFVAIAYWVIGIPVGYFLSFQPHMGAAGIWIGFIAGLSVSSVLLNTRFLHKTKLVTQVEQTAVLPDKSAEHYRG